MQPKSLLAIVLVGLTLAACATPDHPRPATRIASVEEMKKDVAVLRNRGQINYEQAARRQFEIERANYSLTEQDITTWRTAILYAQQYDRRQITLTDYQNRVGALFATYGK